MTYVRAVEEQGTDQPEPAAPARPEPGAPQPARPHAFLLYNLGRLVLLLVALGIFYLLGFRGLALVVVALLVSGAVSYFALYRLRGAAAVSFAGGWRRWNDRLEERTRAEDTD